MGKTIHHVPTIISVRHGEQARSGRDPALTERGRKQIEKSRAALALVLGESGIAACVSSPLRRAAETARILTKGLFPEEDIDYDADFRERSLGVLDSEK